MIFVSVLLRKLKNAVPKRGNLCDLVRGPLLKRIVFDKQQRIVHRNGKFPLMCSFGETVAVVKSHVSVDISRNHSTVVLVLSEGG